MYSVYLQRNNIESYKNWTSCNSVFRYHNTKSVKGIINRKESRVKYPELKHEIMLLYIIHTYLEENVLKNLL